VFLNKRSECRSKYQDGLKYKNQAYAFLRSLRMPKACGDPEHVFGLLLHSAHDKLFKMDESFLHRQESLDTCFHRHDIPQIKFHS